MNVKRKLSEGVASWLMFEFHSNRAQLFGEKYLTTPIGHILSGIYGNQVVAEYSHPILNEHKTWPGRPPQIDFAIRNNGQVEVAVESKWISNSQLDVGDIIWDLIRLELLHYHFKTKCFFVLGGKSIKIQELFQSNRFQEPRDNGRKRPVLRLKKERKPAIRIDSPPATRASLIKARLRQYPNILMPSSIVSGYPDFYPEQCRNQDSKVYVWEICSFKNKPRFYPKDNANYQ